MGQVTIQTNYGGARYGVSVKRDLTRANQRVIEIQAEIDEIDTIQILQLEVQYNDLVAAYQSLANELESILNEIELGNTTLEIEQASITELQKQLVEAAKERDQVKRDLDFMKARRLALLKRKATLEAQIAAADSDTREAWCVDYSQTLFSTGNSLEVNAQIDDGVALSAGYNDDYKKMLELTNDSRSAVSVASVTWDWRLFQAALRMGLDVLENQEDIIFAADPHQGSDGSGIGDRVGDAGYPNTTWAENYLASNIWDEASEAQVQFINSPTHYTNMTNPAYTQMGACHVFDNTKTYSHIWVVVFGADATYVHQEPTNVDPPRTQQWEGETGNLQPTFSSSETGSATFWNWCLLPGWQKYLPTVRAGTISSVDYDNDEAVVNLDAATSDSGQSLSINQSSSVTAKIGYMECFSHAFSPSDRVIVEFQGQNWNYPVVTGFVDNPNRCVFYIKVKRDDGVEATPSNDYDFTVGLYYANGGQIVQYSRFNGAWAGGNEPEWSGAYWVIPVGFLYRTYSDGVFITADFEDGIACQYTTGGSRVYRDDGSKWHDSDRQRIGTYTISCPYFKLEHIGVTANHDYDEPAEAFLLGNPPAQMPTISFTGTYTSKVTSSVEYQVQYANGSPFGIFSRYPKINNSGCGSCDSKPPDYTVNADSDVTGLLTFETDGGAYVGYTGNFPGWEVFQTFGPSPSGRNHTITATYNNYNTSSVTPTTCRLADDYPYSCQQAETSGMPFWYQEMIYFAMENAGIGASYDWA